MTTETILEQRVAVLEQAVADLQCRLPNSPATPNWLDKVTGSISDVLSLFRGFWLLCPIEVIASFLP